ncbi:MAG TPA: glycoside hydrolase family 3 C-terminal domain-containing protein [Solirubrobacteraceae bacterium]|nr:glycoside hydrolase family 3 C-terminal domain-containing protein [Solirubrobacteraceae bacterium]
MRIVRRAAVPAGVCALVLSVLGLSAASAAPAPPGQLAGPALLPTPSCPQTGEPDPWKDPRFGPECQAQYVIEDLENPASPLYAHTSSGAPVQSTLQRLEAAIASGDNIEAADGSMTNLLSLYGLTVTGGTDDGADGERPSGLAFPSALTVGASWDPAIAAAYGTMLGAEFHRTGLSGVLGPVIDIDRTWHTGREQENFGEDPFLTGSLVAPEVRAIQAQGVMATVKHCCAYTQEQGRSGQALTLANPNNTGVNQLVSERALEEIYGPPWQAAVAPQQGNAMSVMCGYAIVDAHTQPPYTGADSCGNEFLLNDLLKGQYGFEGTFTPDAVTAERDSPQLNFLNGGDGGDAQMTLTQLEAIVGNGSADGQTNADGSRNLVSTARLVDEVRRLVLQSVVDERFLNPPSDQGIGDGVAQDEATSARIAEQGAVLLRDRGGVLPLSGSVRSIAVIGTQAGPNTDPSLGPLSPQQPQVSNDGSAYVNPANTFTDTATGQTFTYQSALSGIVARAGAGRTVTFEPGTNGLVEQPALTANGATSGPGSVVTPDGSQAGFLATYYAGNDPTDPADTVLGSVVVPSIQYNSPGGAQGPTSIPGLAAALPPFNGWSVSYEGMYTPPVSGQYSFSVTESGTAKLYIAGRLVAERVRDDFGYVDHATVSLQAGRPISIVLDYSPEEAAANVPTTVPIFNSIFNTFLGDEVHLGVTVPPASGPTLIQQAAAAAAKADVAIVFAGREIGEGHDVETLSLPGDQNQLIEAVAAANPRTVVVLTGGPVAMPWLDRVAGVLEMWEPGATFGTAVASLLFGDSDPSGRLPITFPASDSQGPGQTAAEYPGITNLTTGASDDYDQLEQESFDEGIDVGYRWYETHGQQPLFPFGYGLSYTSFRRRIVRVSHAGPDDIVVWVSDTNTGLRAGADVIEIYVHDPPSTGEPPEQLRAFRKLSLQPGQTEVVPLLLRASAFAYWNSGPATGTEPQVDSPTVPQAGQAPEPPGQWTIAPGMYRIDLGSSAESFDDSAWVHLDGGGMAVREQLNGLFGWSLGQQQPLRREPSLAGRGQARARSGAAS